MRTSTRSTEATSLYYSTRPYKAYRSTRGRARDEVQRADGPFGGYTSNDLDAVIALHPRDAIAASWALSDRLSVKSALRRRDRETSRS